MTTRYEQRAQHLVDDRWIEELREAGLSEWPRATTGEPVNTRRVYYRTHELLVDERSSDSVIGALSEFGPVEVRDSNLGDVGVTILVSGAEDDALLLTRSIGRNLSGLRFAPHYIAIIAQGRPGISPATYPRSVSEAPPVEPSCDTSDQCIAVADTGMWEEPSPPSRL
ncbi:MAG: hypothetical protein ACT4OP_11300, partial [Actinomycetota bacterium]